MNLGNPWFVSVKKGFDDACKEVGADGLVVDSQYKVDKQVGDLESLINDNYNAILISPIDQKATAKEIDLAKSKKIATACVAQSQDNVDFRYIVDEYKYGVMIGTGAANWINSALVGKANVAIISQDNVQATILRGNGVEDTIKKMCPGVTIVARQAGDTPELGMKIIEGVLQQHPDLNVVVGTNDSGAIGGYQAMVQGGATGKDKGVFSGDATSQALALMKKDNSIYRGTVDLTPYDAGYYCAKQLYEYATKGLPSKQETKTFEPKVVSRDDLVSGKYQPKG